MAEEKILVSVCCITYNHAPYIRQCLDGFIMQQSNFQYEILIHDDASTDTTADIIREYEAKYPDLIKPIYQVENQYSKGFRNVNGKFNFPRAKGEYIALCEGDDYWIDPFKLQKQVDMLENNPKIGLVHTELHKYNVTTKKMYKNFCVLDHSNKQEGDVFKTLLLNNILPLRTSIHTCTVCIRKDLLFNNDIFSGASKLDLLFGDYSLWLSLLVKCEAGYINEATAIRNVLPFSATQGRSFEYLYQFYYIDHLKMYHYFKEYCDISEEEEKKNINYRELLLINLCYRFNKRKDLLDEAYNKLTESSISFDIMLKRIALKNKVFYIIIHTFLLIKNKIGKIKRRGLSFLIYKL